MSFLNVSERYLAFQKSFSCNLQLWRLNSKPLWLIRHSSGRFPNRPSPCQNLRRMEALPGIASHCRPQLVSKYKFARTKRREGTGWRWLRCCPSWLFLATLGPNLRFMCRAVLLLTSLGRQVLNQSITWRPIGLRKNFNRRPIEWRFASRSCLCGSSWLPSPSPSGPSARALCKNVNL